MISKNNSQKVLFTFLICHLVLWTLVPTISNLNLPLDTIEALAWATELKWGYNKHPPLSASAVWFIYLLFGANDWAYYLLSQIFVVFSLYFVWKISKFFFEDRILPVLSVLILVSVVFLNYTTPEFNVYVCQLPFKVLTVYFFWKCIIDKSYVNWFLLGLFSGLGFLTHYSFIFLLISLFIFLIYFQKNSKTDPKGFILALITFIILTLPHFLWLHDND